MKTSTIDDVEKVFACSRTASLSWKSIDFPEFESFTHIIQSLIYSVGELDDNDYWYDLISKIRKFRFETLVVPKPETVLQHELDELLVHLQNNKSAFSLSHPGAAERYSSLIMKAEDLKKTQVSHLLQAVKDEVSNFRKSSDVSILVPETRFVTSAEMGLRSVGLGKVQVTSPLFLREDISFANLLIMGPTRWYPSHVFMAPRSENMLILKFVWIRDSWKHQSAFSSPVKQKPSKLMQTIMNEPLYDFLIDADKVLPPEFNFNQVKERVLRETTGHNEVDLVRARLFLLEEGWTVLLETDESSTALVIDLKDFSTPVKKIKTSEIERGMFVLLRTTGGGDFVVPVADQIMGKAGILAREYQQRWKLLLREKIIANGYYRVISALQELGSLRANPINIRNWMSARSIRTEYREDFDAILGYVGLASEKDVYWNLMDTIDHAHRKAGHKIRQMLLDKVRSSDLKTFKRTGKMDFELDAEHSISITAFQIKAISPDTLSVLPWQIGDPLKQSD